MSEPKRIFGYRNWMSLPLPIGSGCETFNTKAYTQYGKLKRMHLSLSFEKSPIYSCLWWIGHEKCFHFIKTLNLFHFSVFTTHNEIFLLSVICCSLDSEKPCWVLLCASMFHVILFFSSHIFVDKILFVTPDKWIKSSYKYVVIAYVICL